MTNRLSAILDDTGKPFQLNGTAKAATGGQSFVQVLDSWYKSIATARAPVEFKVQDPFSYHPWVFAAAMTIATASVHAELQVFRETQAAQALRKSQGSKFRAGRQRRALQRHREKHHLWKRFHRKTLEPMLDHPFIDLISNPNPLQRGSQLMQITILWMAVRGEAFWLNTDENGSPVPASRARMIWPLAPDLFSPVYTRGTFGELTGWDIQLPAWFTGTPSPGSRMRAPIEAVMQVKLPNPTDLVRGMSRLSSVIPSIETDMMATAFLRSLFENRAVPGGVLEYPGNITRKEEDEIQERIKLRHGGPDKAGNMLLLQGGLKFNATALTPQDLESQQAKKTGREEVLGVMATPPSALGLQDIANYATAQVFERGFWDKGVMPILMQIQTAIDSTYFFAETDDVFAMFDTSNVEAFRAGTDEKVDTALKLTAQGTHMPPRDAFAVVGLDVPEYEGDDVCLVPALVVPLKSVLQAEEDGGPGAGPDHPEGGAPPPPPPAAVPEQGGDENVDPAVEDDPAADAEQAKARTKASAAARWAAFAKALKRVESKAKSAYRSWAFAQRAETMAKLEAEAARVGAKGWSHVVKASSIDVSAVVPGLGSSQSKLKSKVRPIFSAAVSTTFDLTTDELGGVPSFTVDDARILDVLEKREKKLLDTVPVTLRKNLTKSLAQGVANGESIQQLRTRVSEVFDLATSSSKSLAVARTEAAGLMSNVRHEMFALQGFEKLEWVTAGDEHVRPDHEEFGAAGAKKLGFDYMTLVEGGSGSLKMPGDPEAPANQVVNCRCIQIPVS